MSNYTTKLDVKNTTDGNTSYFAKRADLASLKSKVDKLDIDKLGTIPDDLSELSNVPI